MTQHPTSGVRCRRLPCMALFLVAASLTLGGYSLARAEPQAPPSPAGAAAENQPATASPAEGPAQETSGMAEREKGKKEQEELEALRKSPSVMKLSSMTGMTPGATYWASVMLNFVLIAALLIYLLRGKAPAFFRERTAGIQKSMGEATRVSQEATQRLQQIEERLGKLDLEIDAMRATAEKEARAEEERLKQATAEEQHRLLEAAQQEIASATSQARRELKGFAADLAISLAAQQIHVDAAADKNLVQTFASHLGQAQAGPEPAGAKPAGNDNP